MPAGAGWGSIFPGLDPDPVRGSVDDHRQAADEARAVALATAAMHAEFSRLGSGPIVEMRGATADRLAALVGEIDAGLTDLNPVFADLTEIFDRHAEQLAALRTQAGEALARAVVRWNDLDAARACHAGERATLVSIERQLAAVRDLAADPVAGGQVASLEARRWSQHGAVIWWEQQVARHETDLDDSRAEFGAMVAAEDELIAATVAALGSVPLGELRDPTGLLHAIGELVGGAWELVSDLAGWAADAVALTVQGFAAALVEIAETVMSAAVTALSVAIGVALVGLAAWGLVQLLIVTAPVVGAIVGIGLVAWSLLPPPARLAVLGRLRDAVRGVFDSSPGGDRGDTYETHQLDDVDWAPAADQAGRASVVAALELLTGDPPPIAPDEFALVRLDNGKCIVVLPGVTDLTNPDLGLNAYNRTVRDLDQYALPSSTSSAVSDNRYAEMVVEALARLDLPEGSELMIVGHSFGADTALDLAASPSFNSTYQVSHVVAAAYHSGPQLADVSADTNVLVLQNANDLAVQVEAAGYHPVAAAESYAEAIGDFLSGDLLGGVASVGDSLGHAGGSLIGGIVLASGGNPLASTTTPGVTQPRPNQTVAVFDGDGRGAGHHPTNYTDYLVTHTSETVDAFEASVGEAGFAGPGDVYVVDVSVPAER